MKDVANRRAALVSTLVAVRSPQDPEPLIAEGCAAGEIAREPAGEHGFGFDGSSIRGWQAINESDMLLIPVADTARIDPFMEHRTLILICDVRDPISKKEY